MYSEDKIKHIYKKKKIKTERNKKEEKFNLDKTMLNICVVNYLIIYEYKFIDSIKGIVLIKSIKGKE